MRPDSSWTGSSGSQGFECRGYKSCKDSYMWDVELCSGAESCDNMVMGSASSVYCSGKNACRSTNFTDGISGDIYCTGSQAVCQRSWEMLHVSCPALLSDRITIFQIIKCFERLLQLGT